MPRTRDKTAKSQQRASTASTAGEKARVTGELETELETVRAGREVSWQLDDARLKVRVSSKRKVAVHCAFLP